MKRNNMPINLIRANTLKQNDVYEKLNSLFIVTKITPEGIYYSPARCNNGKFYIGKGCMAGVIGKNSKEWVNWVGVKDIRVNYPVTQINTKTGEIIGSYSCLDDASVATKIPRRSIRDSINKVYETGMGYRWEKGASVFVSLIAEHFPKTVS